MRCSGRIVRKKRAWVSGAMVAVIAALPVAIAGIQSPSAGAVSRAKGKVVIGYSAYTLSNPFFLGVEQGLAKAAKAKGWTVNTTNANVGLTTQLDNVQTLITEHVSAIVITPLSETGLVPAVKDANKAGIPVFTLADVVDGGKIVSEVSVNQVEAAQLSTEYLVKQLEKRYGCACGNVVDIEGLTGVSAATYRQEGFEKVIKKYPKIHVVAEANGGFAETPSYTVMKTILAAHSTIRAIFAANDTEAGGVVEALKGAGRLYKIGNPKHIILTSIDGDPPGIVNIRAGYQTATYEEPVFAMGKDIINFIYDHLHGKRVPKELVPRLQLITPSNIKSKAVKNFGGGIWATLVKSS